MTNQATPIRSLSVQGKEWFDKVNGNSYFSAVIQINGEPVHKLPFQYGYGSHYLDMANQWLAENGYIDNPPHNNGSRTSLWSYCQDHHIDFYYSMSENCKKREL